MANYWTENELNGEIELLGNTIGSTKKTGIKLPNHGVADVAGQLSPMSEISGYRWENGYLMVWGPHKNDPSKETTVCFFNSDKSVCLAYMDHNEAISHPNVIAECEKRERFFNNQQKKQEQRDQENDDAEEIEKASKSDKKPFWLVCILFPFKLILIILKIIWKMIRGIFKIADTFVHIAD